MKAVNNVDDLEEVIPVVYKEDLFDCPMDNRLAISMNGRVYNKRTNRFIAIVPSGKERPRLGLVITQVGVVTKRYTLHRLLARTFIGRPSRHLDKEYSKLEVNHIDGNQLNNELDNLEWVTNDENVKHALDNNLWNSLKEVQVRNNITGICHSYRSLHDISTQYGIHLATLSKHLNSSQAGMYNYSGYSFRFKSDLVWPKLMAKKRMSMLAIAIDLHTKTSHTFNSLADAARYIKEAYNAINKALVVKDKKYWRSKNGKWEVHLVK